MNRVSSILWRSFLLTSALLVISFPSVQAARIGFFLGSFDPPHLGVARMVEEARSRLHLDTIYVIPTPEPVDRHEVAPVKHRLAMIRLMAQGIPGMETLTEADLTVIASRHHDSSQQHSPSMVIAGSSPHRGNNLFAALREDIMSRRPPEDEVFQIIGEDALPKLIARRQLPGPDERRTLVVFPRPGFPVTQHPSLAALEKNGRLLRLDVAIQDLASRDLRALMRERSEPTADQVPEATRCYIRREGLYGLPATHLTRDTLATFEPEGYLAKPVLLHGPTTDTSFVPAHLESFLSPRSATGACVSDLRSPPDPTGAGKSESDFPPALARMLAHHVIQVTLFKAPTTDALDWLEAQGWRTLYGFVPHGGDDRPMLFFGRRGLDWHLFVTGIFAQDRFARLAAEVRDQCRRFEVPPERLLVLVPTQP